MADRQRGQASVELVLALPVVVLALLAVIQVGLIVRSQVLVVDAARRGARAASVSGQLGDAAPAARQTPGLRPERIEVDAADAGAAPAMVRVEVRYRAPTDVPLVGSLVRDVELSSTLTMAVEPGSSG